MSNFIEQCKVVRKWERDCLLINFENGVVKVSEDMGACVRA